MFQNLPEIKENNLEAFIGGNDFGHITREVNKYIAELRKKNPRLARAVEGSAATAVELDYLEFSPHLKETLLGNCVVAILLVLAIIDREMGITKLQKIYGDVTIKSINDI